ncbi:MAG: extracellular solute-binding protein [Meiothermus sp.]|nr:extracellular solute-binding protein [Meiothermus sp.]
MKHWIKWGLAAAAAAGLGMAQGWTLEAAATPYKGSKVSLVTVAWPDAIRALAADFTRRTGIEVEVTQIPGSQILEKTLLELRNRGTAFDLYTATYKRPYTQARVTLSLNGFLADPKLADPTWNPNDFVRYSQFATDPDSPKQIVGIPFGASGMAMFVRKDLFANPAYRAAFRARYGRELEAPKTWKELEQTAAFFSEADFKSFSGAKGVGIAMQLTRSGDGLMWWYALASGGLALEGDKTRISALLDKQNRMAAERYSQPALELIQRLSKFAQPAALQADDTAARELFLGGGAAIVLTWDSFLGRLDSGQIAGRWELSPIPSRTLLGGWALHLNPNSKNQQAAFLLAQFLSSKESDLKMFELAGRYPARASSYNSATYRKVNPFGDIFALSKSGGIAQWDSIASTQFNATVAEKLSLMLAGQLTPGGANEGLKTAIARVLEDAGLR